MAIIICPQAFCKKNSSYIMGMCFCSFCGSKYRVEDISRASQDSIKDYYLGKLGARFLFVWTIAFIFGAIIFYSFNRTYSYIWFFGVVMSTLLLMGIYGLGLKRKSVNLTPGQSAAYRKRNGSTRLSR